MPQHKSAIKRVRQNKKRRDHNRKLRSKLRTLVNKVLEATDKEKAEEYLKEATSYVDKMSSKGIIHENNGARKKAKMTKHVNNL
ncbi:MAG: 30S ribosomal protein S20 [Balneolaceae bacterium]|nr:30S ribosomal protein S20 [Balneolaceae bacterium]